MTKQHVHALQNVGNDPDAILSEQYIHLRVQIPLMYALMGLNSAFLGFATYGDVPIGYSIGVPAVLCAAIGARSLLWIRRRANHPTPQQIRQYLKETLVAAAILSAAFGGWGVLLLEVGNPVRITAIALYVFVGSISCCYCLQVLPNAGRIVLLFGAMPITAHLLLSGDGYLAGVAMAFILASVVILRTLSSSHAAFREVIRSRAEMHGLVTALSESDEHYRHSVALNPQMPWICDPSGALTEISPKWLAITGMPIKDALGSGWAKALHPDDRPVVQDLWVRSVESGHAGGIDTRYRLRQKDGTYRWVRARAYPRLGSGDEVKTWYGNLEDIHDQVLAESALQASEERYRLASLATNDVIWDMDLEMDRINWSSSVATLLGYPEAVGGTSRGWWLERIHPEEHDAVLARFQDMDSTGLNQWVQEFRFLAGGGNYLHLVARGHVVREASGRPVRLIGSLQDVTAQKRYEETLRWAAHYDALTGLPNRALFADRLDDALLDALQPGRSVGLVVLDVDRFKIINDNLGHDAGDALLCEIAERLKSCAPIDATVARLGGDEFALILPRPASTSWSADDVQTLLSGVTRPVHYKGRQIEISISAGIAVAVVDGKNAEELHKCADLALYAAKREGGGNSCRFHSRLRDAAERETQMLADARYALKEDRIFPFYQPKVCFRTGACIGFEALLRWQHDGIRSPASIQAALDDSALSVELTDRMLDRVIDDMLAWRRKGLDFGRVALNGSAGDFRRGDFAQRILGRLERAGLLPRVLELEVTESVFVGQLADNVGDALAKLSDAGTSIALDDFGTGFASLTHLKQFPVDTLKIDRSFVSKLGMVESQDDAIIVAVIDLAKNLGISTVAEGIETAPQFAQLLLKQCDAGQGFLFGRPIAATAVEAVIADWDAEAVMGLSGSSDWAIAARQFHAERFN
jgi:diguanylate cyclase (GGDEF)-like protein/PAS domain S-box-containing protein